MPVRVMAAFTVGLTRHRTPVATTRRTVHTVVTAAVTASAPTPAQVRTVKRTVQAMLRKCVRLFGLLPMVATTAKAWRVPTRLSTAPPVR